MPRTTVATTQAPAAIGPYSQAVKTDQLVFVSGQLALDPQTGDLLQGDIQAQTRQALQNVKAVLEAAGSDLTRVLKTTLYITCMEDFAAINAVYAEFFEDAPPARACVEVSALPKGGQIEIEAIAHT